MNIRPLDGSDFQQFQSLRLRSLVEHPEAFGPSVEEEQNMPLEQGAQMLRPVPERFTLGAFEDQTLVGFAGFYQMNRLKMKHKGHIWGMYVAPEARGKGIGRALLDAIIVKTSTLEDLEEIVLAVTVGNDYARMIYVGAGFEPYCIEPRLLKVGTRYYDVEWLSRRIRL